MAKKKESLSDFLAASSPESPETLKTMTAEELDHRLKEVEKDPDALSLIGSQLIPGSTSTEITDASKALAAGYSPSQIAADVFDKKEAAKAKPVSQAGETKAIETELDTGPWASLTQGTVKQYEQEQAPVAAAVSGATGATSQEAAANQALASLGLSSGSSAGQWLESNIAAGQESAAPVSQAMSQYGAQYAAEAGPITKALMAYGQANELSVSTAPEQAWLNALSSHVTSNLSYYGEVPTSSVSGLSSGVLEALQQSGGYPGSTGSGLTPLSSLGVQNGQVTQKPNATTDATASLGGGTVPGTSPGGSAGGG